MRSSRTQLEQKGLKYWFSLLILSSSSLWYRIEKIVVLRFLGTCESAGKLNFFQCQGVRWLLLSRVYDSKRRENGITFFVTWEQNRLYLMSRFLEFLDLLCFWDFDLSNNGLLVGWCLPNFLSFVLEHFNFSFLTGALRVSLIQVASVSCWEWFSPYHCEAARRLILIRMRCSISLSLKTNLLFNGWRFISPKVG